jgi:isoquinoline 1-oxidoreductase alpha subunit
MAIFNLNVNGQKRQVDVDPSTPLLWVLRDHLNLLGTKYGCGVAQCGSCTVHVDGVATRSCALPISAVTEAQKIVTIEGLSPNSSHALQKAWLANDVPQCGYCQSGQLMAATALLKATPAPTEAEIAAAMTNLCRCGTYNAIAAGVRRAAEPA